jgi:phosphoglycolate phosphatase
MPVLVAFDLDGVLYSSEPFLGEAYREAVAAVNARRPHSFARVPTTREILDHVGWPVTVIIQRLFPHTDAEALALLEGETLRCICAHVVRGEGIVFPGVPGTLARLQAQGFLLTVVSNGRRQYVETVLNTARLAAYFAELVTVDDPPGREKAGLVRAYLQRHGLAAGEAVVVGDRRSDVEAAAAVGAGFVGCDYGHGYRHEIEGAGPIVAAFEELPGVLATVCKHDGG